MTLAEEARRWQEAHRTLPADRADRECEHLKRRFEQLPSHRARRNWLRRRKAQAERAGQPGWICQWEKELFESFGLG